MDVPDDAAAIAEAVLWDYDPRYMPEGTEGIEREDLVLWTRPSPSKWSSGVRLARWSEADVERGIDEVFRHFDDLGRPFVWNVGPSSRPRDLADRLRARGMTDESRTRLLFAPLPLPEMRRADVRIVDAREPATIGAFLRFGHPGWSEDDVADAIPERRLFLDVYDERAGLLLAYIGDELVANAAWRDSTDGRCVYLTGAGTIPVHRGRGIYQTLVAYRCERAMGARGCRYAAIQAQEDTSMPILLRHGFTDVGVVPVLARRPSPS